VASKVTGPGTYYLKIAFYGTFGGGNQDARVGFDDAGIAWAGVSSSAGTSYPAIGTLESSTFDTGTSSGYHTLSWESVAPSGTSVAFQLATSPDGSSWSYTGPDGTASTEYQTSGSIVNPVSDGGRYVRYRAILRSSVPTSTPELLSARLEYSP
jgi:hypothetical protein